MTVIVSAATQDALRRRIGNWAAFASNADVRAVSRDHQSCITEFVAETARGVSGTLARVR